VHRKNVLGQIDAYEYDGQGLRLAMVVDQSSHFPSWYLVADFSKAAPASGWEGHLCSLLVSSQSRTFAVEKYSVSLRRLIFWII
jgi:YD repeat-containing protein